MSSNQVDYKSILPPTQGVGTHLSEHGLIAVAWTGAGLGILFTGLRLAIRITRMKRLLIDDYFVLLALFFLVSNAILQTLQAPHLYYMMFDRGPDYEYHTLMYTHFMFVIIVMFWSVLWSIKGAFLALFWVISDGLPKYRRWWWVILFIAVSSYVGCWFASAWSCHPPSDYFRFGGCNKDIDHRGVLISIYYSTAVDILTDLLIMTLSIRIVWSTSITFQQKLGLGVVFCLGAVIIAFAAVRAVNIVGKSYQDQAGLAVWSLAESSISVIIGCLPPFKTFLTRKTETYTSSRYPAYDRSGASTRQKRPWTHTTSWSELPLDRDMDNEYELHMRDVQVSTGRATSHPSEEGEIRMVKEFSVVRA